MSATRIVGTAAVLLGIACCCGPPIVAQLAGSRQDEDADETAPTPLPDEARRFAGMIRGFVLAKPVVDEVREEIGLVVEVGQVLEVWRNNRADDPDSVVGERVLVTASRAEGSLEEPFENHTRLIDLVEIGESIDLDVRHEEGERLIILELTEQQRRRIEQAD